MCVKNNHTFNRLIYGYVAMSKHWWVHYAYASDCKIVNIVDLEQSGPHPFQEGEE